MRRFVALVIAATSSLAAPSALADVTPPPGDCANKKPGEACTDDRGTPGACGDVGYTRTWTPPMPGSTPQTSQSTYFGCKGGAAPTVKKGCSVTVVGAPTSTPAVLMVALVLVLVRRFFGGGGRIG